MSKIVLKLTPDQALHLKDILEERGENLELSRGEGSAAEEARDAVALDQLETLLAQALNKVGL